MKNIIEEEWGLDIPIHDPHTNDTPMPAEAHCFFISTKHSEFLDYDFPEGSIIIDPWRYIPDMDGITVHRIGESLK